MHVVEIVSINGQTQGSCPGAGFSMMLFHVELATVAVQAERWRQRRESAPGEDNGGEGWGCHDSVPLFVSVKSA